MVYLISSFLRGRSNQSRQLALDDTATSEALEIHNALFLRAFEILRHLSTERASFEMFSSWLIMMAEDVLAHEDANVEPPPLHKIDTVKVAEYLEKHFSTPILSKFAIDMQPDYGEGSYLGMLNRLMELMRAYFARAAEQLKEGVEWVLPDWIDLQINDEIASSDAQMIIQVVLNSRSILTFRVGRRCFSLLSHYQSTMKVNKLEAPLI